MRKCTLCQETKDLSQFHKAGKGKTGTVYYRSDCKPCRSKTRSEKAWNEGKIKTKPHNKPSSNLIGKKFHKLLVIEYIGKQKLNYKPSWTEHMWLCQCDCGKKIKLSDHHLKSKNTQSCGCLSHRKGKDNPRFKGYKEITGTNFCCIRSNAKIRNIEFNITIEYIWDLYIKQNKKCALTNWNINFPTKPEKRGTASLDRTDNTKGYIEGNVQWVHKDVNKMKLDHKQSYFIEMCHAVSMFLMDV